jgi:flagellar L-ring protein precursor FlgH
MSKDSRMRSLLALGIACSVSFACAQDPNKSMNPGSLWNGTIPDKLRDRVARQVGDVVTILISEVSSSTYSAGTVASKNDRTDIAKGIGPILANILPAWGVGADSKIDGKGTTQQTGRFNARMSAIVKEVMPNGTMLVEGTRSITTNKETQTFVLSGLVRMDDVRPDNTVFSESLANATIKVEGKGLIADRTRRGILSRLLDWLF